jgi:Tol biopolymer transport system component
VERAYYARYLPTGHILFSRDGALFAVPFDLKRLAASGSPVMLLDDVLRTGLEFEYAVSADGTLVYVPARVPQRTLVWVDRRGAAEPVPLLPPGGYDTVALSPDGGRMAAVTEEKDQTTGLVVGDFARGTLSRSTAEGSFGSAVWAPDGKRLAVSFQPSRLGQAPKLYGAFWQSADLSTPPERLTSESALQQEEPNSFSPDGRQLLVYVFRFSDTSAAHSLCVLPWTETKTLRPFLQGKAYYNHGRFSPDGQWVAYDSDESDESKPPEVFVRPFPGPGPRWQISTSAGIFPHWSPSGRELFYLNWKDEKLMAVDVETAPTFRAGRPHVLFPTHSSDYDVAPDGSRFLMIQPDPAEFAGSHVNVVLNWFEEVKAKVAAAKR